MGQLYDSAAKYDWAGTYDGGLDMPVGPPGHANVVRALAKTAAPSHNPIRAPWGEALPVQSNVRLVAQAAAPYFHAQRFGWGVAAQLQHNVRVTWGSAGTHEAIARVRWERANPFESIKRIVVRKARELLQQILHVDWGIADIKNGVTALAWSNAEWHQSAKRLNWRQRLPREVICRIRWRPGAQQVSGYTLPWTDEPPLPPGSTIVIPPRDVYFMIPMLSIIRTSDSADLNAIDCSIRYDLNSYAWTFQANCPLASLALVDPNTRSDPELVQINVNGYLFNMIVEGYSDSRKFGGTGVQIIGRSRSALLGAPYAPRSTFTETSSKDASQLATDALDGTGWTLVWNAVDWLVPGSTFTYADKTPIEAVAQIVNAIGAVLYCDPETLTLTVQAMYETSPWHWSGATPYAEIPNAFWTNASGQWQGQGAPDYDGVIVSGQNGGVVGLVKLTGTAGANQLPPVNDSLIVHVDAGRERGRIELGKGLKRKSETIQMPVLPAPVSPTNPGIVPPGSLLQVHEQDAVDGTPGPTWLGQVMSVQIDAQKAKVRQTNSVERHA